jgi:hypothetical protein
VRAHDRFSVPSLLAARSLERPAAGGHCTTSAGSEIRGTQRHARVIAGAGRSANREAPAEVRERPVGGADMCHPTRWRLASGERARGQRGLRPAEAELNEPCATLGVVTREPGNARPVASFYPTRGCPREPQPHTLVSER